MITWLLSDRGTLAIYSMIEGFGVNTYKWISADCQAVYIKCHWKPKLGIHRFNRTMTIRITGEDPDYLTIDLWNATDTGNNPQWELNIQVMPISEELNQTLDPLDDTKTVASKQLVNVTETCMPSTSILLSP